MTQAPAKTEPFGRVGPPTLDRPRSMNAHDDVYEGMRAFVGRRPAAFRHC
jgi:hypothetical protein